MCKFTTETIIPHKRKFVKRDCADKADFDAAEPHLRTPTGATTYDYFGKSAQLDLTLPNHMV
jgi:hypothetical protein